MNRRHDTLMLRLIWRQWLNALQATRASILLQLLAFGGFFLAYFLADITITLRSEAPALRGLDALWLFGLPAATAILGGGNRSHYRRRNRGSSAGAFPAGASAVTRLAPTRGSHRRANPHSADRRVFLRRDLCRLRGHRRTGRPHSFRDCLDVVSGRKRRRNICPALADVSKARARERPSEAGDPEIRESFLSH
jgi:hypothetical protein